VTNEITTCRRHLEARHLGAYRQWCKANDVESKLPKDVKARKAQAVANAERQTTVNEHFPIKGPSERVIPYSDQLFKEASEDWLVSTDQPICAFEHPKFRNMIDIASRAPTGV
ncbi:hypothetical protein K435DRAFT_586643, partial [Dendrothele bispora CBS 962.96]